MQMPREIGAYEAKTRLPELLREVEQGGRITITVRGRPVAELVPARTGGPSADDAVRAMKAFEPIKGISDREVRDWISEGRR